jgi:hypothetical protein
MRFTASLPLIMVLLGVSGCESPKSSESSQSDSRVAESINQKARASAPAQPQAITELSAMPQNVSLTQADSANVVSQALERKIIRNANLTVEVSSPAETQRKIVSIAESHQGFVVTSESTQRTAEDKTKPEVTINLVIRVPAAQFNQVMEEIRAVGTRVPQEKTTGQDVTEEFIDLEARIKNQKALEAQFIEIMKRAGKVEDALEVQRELADVRTEIEKLEGRRRFLQNQASLSTINVTLQTPTQIVNATGFWYSVRSAFADGVDVAAAIVLFLIRAIVALLPVLVLIVFPIALITRFVVRRFGRRHTFPQDVDKAGATG